MQKNHFLLVKKLKNTESAQLFIFIYYSQQQDDDSADWVAPRSKSRPKKTEQPAGKKPEATTRPRAQGRVF